MELQEFVSTSIVSIMQAIKAADDALQSGKLGAIWRGDLDTHGEHLVHVHLVKGKTDVKGVSTPVLLLDYDVQVIVEQTTESGISAELGLGGKVLQILTFSGKVEGHSDKSKGDKAVQNLKFTIPVALRVP